MFRKVLLSIVLIVVLFFGYVSTRQSQFHIEDSAVIRAPIEKVFPYVSDLKKGGEWSPFEKVDPLMKKDFIGASDQVGAKLIFQGNSDAGAGSLEILKIQAPETVELHLIMTAPFPADNLIQYKLETVPEGTRFTWIMSGDGGFLGKLISVFIDCDTMIKKQFQLGFQNLNQLMEGK